MPTRQTAGCVAAVVFLLLPGFSRLDAGEGSAGPVLTSSPHRHLLDSTVTPAAGAESSWQRTYSNAWGLDILISSDGFGLGTFYRKEFNDDLSGFLNFSISESKDEREVEFIDIFGNSFVPGKLNRFLVMPLTIGVQMRMFREQILDTFRPYVNMGAGPTMIFAAPFSKITTLPSGGLLIEQVEFFSSLGKGQPHYTVGAFVGFGANFGADKSNLFGVNFRYYFTYLFGDGLPSLYDGANGQVAQRKKSFGGFFITLNVGMAY